MSDEPNWLEFFEDRERLWAEYYLEFAEENARRDPKAHEQIELESGNLSLIIAWLAEHDEFEGILRLAEALWQKSDFMRIRGFIQRGLPLLEEARRSAQQLGDLRAEFTWLDALTIARGFNGDSTLTLPLHEQLLALAQKINEPEFEAKAQLEMGSLQMEMGNLDDALIWLNQALQNYRQIQDYKGEVNTLINLGNLLSLQGNVEDAVAHLQHGLCLAEAEQDKQGELNLRFALGYVGTATQDWSMAVKHFEPVIKMAQDIGDRFLEIRGLHNLGEAWLELGDIQKAISLLEAALDIQEISDDILTKAFTHLYLAKAHNILASPDVSLAHLEHVYPLSQVPILFHEAATAAWVKADNYLKKNDTCQAQIALQDVLALAPDHMADLRMAAETLLNSLTETGRFDNKEVVEIVR